MATGMTRDRMREEARDIIELLEDHQDEMNPKDFNFYVGIVEDLDVFGGRARITERQLFWLRDMRDRYAL